jgi:hypothetical protein
MLACLVGAGLSDGTEVLTGGKGSACTNALVGGLVTGLMRQSLVWA